MRKACEIGAKYNRLTVTSLPRMVAGVETAVVDCICDCGTTKPIRWKFVHSGKTKSCGCLHREKAAESGRKMFGPLSGNFIDLAGKRIGSWTFLHLDETKPRGNGVFWVCKCDCGTVRSRMSRARHDLSCGCSLVQSLSNRKMEDHPHWKGGRRYTNQGYVRVRRPDHHRTSNVGYVLEHILVMEQKVGRPLLKGETVHHINGVRDDNRPENLELWDRNHPCGQRHTEKMAFHIQEIVTKATDTELATILKAIQKRIRQRSERVVPDDSPSLFSLQ